MLRLPLMWRGVRLPRTERRLLLMVLHALRLRLRLRSALLLLLLPLMWRGVRLPRTERRLLLMVLLRLLASAAGRCAHRAPAIATGTCCHASSTCRQAVQCSVLHDTSRLRAYTARHGMLRAMRQAASSCAAPAHVEAQLQLVGRRAWQQHQRVARPHDHLAVLGQQKLRARICCQDDLQAIQAERTASTCA